MEVRNDMNDFEYVRARKLALKEYGARMQKGLSPYLPVLAEIEEKLNALTRVPLGLIQVPLNKVVGTASKGRTNAFAANFMPLLDPGSEFCHKWSALYEGVVEDGLRQPVTVLEYLGKYYLVEGNKRVSVMKYLDAVAIEADVIRVLPERTDDPENVAYFEYVDFYADTGINYLWFSRPGSCARLYALTGREPGRRWTSEERRDFEAAYTRFRTEYKVREAAQHGENLPATTGDAFLIYLEATGYEDAPKKYNRQIKGEIKALWGEFEKQDRPSSVKLVLKPQELKQGSSLMNSLFGPSRVKAAFLYAREPRDSGWTYWHDLGRVELELAMGDRVATEVCVCEDPARYEAEIERLIGEGASIVFTTSPLMLSAAMKASVKYPGAKVLNCSLLASWQRVRSYYLRIHEAKFLTGMIAGALTENDRIGYIGDYPIYGVAASINAFALGARMVNPRARVALSWSTRENFDPQNPFIDPDVQIISGRDVSAPRYSDVEYGLYEVKEGRKQSIAIPLFDWGRLYKSLTRSVLKGNWEDDGSSAPRAVNYWWGLSSDALDIVTTERLDPGLRRLLELVREQIRQGLFWPFEGRIVDQDGVERCPKDGHMTPADVISMDWLVDNVVGGFPETGELKPEARALVELQGIREIQPPSPSSFSWKAEG